MYSSIILWLCIYLQLEETCGQLGPLELLNNPVGGIFIISNWSADRTVIEETPPLEIESNKEQSAANITN